MMTYNEAREYIQAVSKTGSVLGLAGIQNLMQELSDVQETLSIIHLAGTNGKGSVGAYLSSALMEAGHTVGRYTSPAVFSPLEVWQINGVPITEPEYAKLVSQVKSACDVLVSKGISHPTVFEVETAMAFLWFSQKSCDYVLLETGMGGSTDATNLITHPVCSVITSISMDHMQFLGDSLGEIAAAKAGIIKQGCSVVTVEQKPEAMEVIRRTAKKLAAPLLVVDPKKAEILESSLGGMVFCCPSFSLENEIELRTKMIGICQVENAMLAMAVLCRILGLPEDVAKCGMEKAVWRGRFEIVRQKPLVIVDGAHNEDAVKKLCKTVQMLFPEKKLTYVIGVLADKEHEKILETMLPLAKQVFTVTPPNARALDGRILAEEARACIARLRSWDSIDGLLEEHNAAAESFRKEKRMSAIEMLLGEETAKTTENLPKVIGVEFCDSIQGALGRAIAAAGEDGVVIAFGSLSYLGEVKESIRIMRRKFICR